jgi:hypothetical protein
MAQALADKMVGKLRHHGNSNLASRWSAAFIELEAAAGALSW